MTEPVDEHEGSEEIRERHHPSSTAEGKCRKEEQDYECHNQASQPILEREGRQRQEGEVRPDGFGHGVVDGQKIGESFVDDVEA